MPNIPPFSESLKGLPYGAWIRPDGSVIPVPSQEHSSVAYGECLRCGFKGQIASGEKLKARGYVRLVYQDHDWYIGISIERKPPMMRRLLVWLGEQMRDERKRLDFSIWLPGGSWKEFTHDHKNGRLSMHRLHEWLEEHLPLLPPLTEGAISEAA